MMVNEETMLSYLTPQPMKAYSCCLLGPQSFLACAQERLERVQDESSAAEEHKKKLSGDAIKFSVLSSFTLQ